MAAMASVFVLQRVRDRDARGETQAEARIGAARLGGNGKHTCFVARHTV
jgi:hypothetical protein